MTFQFSTLVLLLISAAAVLCIFFLLRQLQQARVAAATAEERLLGRQQELEISQASLLRSQDENRELLAELQQGRERLASMTTSLELERKQFDEKLALLNESRDKLTVEFKNIANEIFEDKSKKFTDTSKASLTTILSPLQEKISQFEKRVEETYDKESKERFSLAREIKSLQELNNRISEEAINLTNALKGDNKAQGSWGEFVLESILEKSGLVKGREYEVQVSMKAEDGSKLQPDVVVHLPESRDIIIDSKVSLKAWDAYNAADEDSARTELMKQHVASIRNHVNGLSSKDYQNLADVNSLDYVFLFMPIEAAYTAAIQEDPNLFQYAFERNIIFVVPTTLLTSLKTVQNLWRLAQQNQNANEIAEKAGALYDKFVAFVDDLEEIGNRIDTSKKSYEKAHNKLVSGRGNLVRRAETLRELGAKTSKQLKAGSAMEAEPDADLQLEDMAKDSESEKAADDAADQKARH